MVPVAPSAALRTRGDAVLAAPSGYVIAALWLIDQTLPNYSHVRVVGRHTAHKMGATTVTLAGLAVRPGSALAAKLG